MHFQEREASFKEFICSVVGTLDSKTETRKCICLALIFAFKQKQYLGRGLY